MKWNKIKNYEMGRRYLPGGRWQALGTQVPTLVRSSLCPGLSFMIVKPATATLKMK